MKFTILGIPKTKQSFRFAVSGKFVRKYQPKEVKEEVENIRSEIIKQLPIDFQPLKKGIYIKKCWFVFPPLVNFSKKKLKLVELEQLEKTTQPDLTDNLFKGLIDAMQGVVFINDSQICMMNDIKKFYGPKPRIELNLEEL